MTQLASARDTALNDPDEALDSHARAILTPTLGQFGIARVADLTRLDGIGLPVAQAVRPRATTLKVSSGRGLTFEQAWVSAVMESLELWHAEHVGPALHRSAAGEVDLGYDPLRLAQEETTALDTSSVLDWIPGYVLGTQEETWIPRDAVHLNFSRSEVWRPANFFISSTGLGGGTTTTQAAIHALLEVVERDAVSRALTGEGPIPERVAPRNLTGSGVGEVLALLARADARLIVERYNSPTGLPVFGVVIACSDYPLLTSGYGCDLSAEGALLRALTEAAQTRTTFVAGARDDLSQCTYDKAAHDRYRELDCAPTSPAVLTGSPRIQRRTQQRDLNVLIEHCTAAFDGPPLAVDLASQHLDLEFVRVLQPGARLVQAAI